MAALYRSFVIYSSFHQRLALLVVFCIGLTSFSLWPAYQLSHIGCKYAAIILCCILFFKQWHKLNHWQYAFMLNSDNDGYFIKNNNKYKNFTLLPVLINPIFILLIVEYISPKGIIKKHVITIFFDMLSDENYRHLCRGMIKNKQKEN